MPPLTEKGREIMGNMRKQYGERAEEVFYRSRNAGTIKGVDSARDPIHGYLDACHRGDSAEIERARGAFKR